MYQLGQPNDDNRPRRLRRILGLSALFIVAVIVAIIILRLLKSDTVIHQSTADTTTISFSSLQHYDEPDFSIDLPVSWVETAKPIDSSQDYAWQSVVQPDTGQLLEIYEDVLPTTFPVTRLLVIKADGNHLDLVGSGTASANCNSFTPSKAPVPNELGVLDSWQGTTFLCDEVNRQRDLIGTSSADGINTVSLKSPTSSIVHKFFFTYTNHDPTNPNSIIFYNALKSFRVK